MKNIFHTFIVIALVLGLYIFPAPSIAQEQQTEADTTTVAEEEPTASDSDTAAQEEVTPEATTADENLPEFVIFVDEDCPHCKKVEAYVEAQNLEQYIEYKQLKDNPTNQKELEDLWGELEIKENVGWPFMYQKDNKEVYEMGDQPIINHLADAYGLESTTDSTDTQSGQEVISESDRVFFLIGGLFVASIIGYAIYSFMKEE